MARFSRTELYEKIHIAVRAELLAGGRGAEDLQPLDIVAPTEILQGDKILLE
jgi:hypothetical protein